MRTLAKIVLVLCTIFAFVSAASAQQINAQTIQSWLSSTQPSSALGTPDGVPPSGETICAGQTGAAHGLCTAYCEAMDCDSANPQASPTACAKVAANFTRITGQGSLPCDCPCVSQFPGWIDAVNGPISSCFEGSFFGLDIVILINPDGSYDPAAGTLADSSGGICGDFSGGGGLSITVEQGAACKNTLRQRAAAAGVTCQGPSK